MEPQMPSSPFDNAADSGTSFPPQTSQIPSASVASSPQVSFSQPTPTAPAFALKMEPESTISSMNTTSSMMSEEMNHYNGYTPERRRKGFSYPFIGLITIAAGIVLAAEQYGLGNLIPYPLSGLIAAGLVTLVGLWLLAKGRLGRILAFWLGLAIVAVIGGMIYDTMYPGTLPSSGSRGIMVGYDKTGTNLTLHLGTVPFSGSETVIVPPTPLEDYIMADGYEDEENTPDTSMTGYTITVTGSTNSGTK